MNTWQEKHENKTHMGITINIRDNIKTSGQMQLKNNTNEMECKTSSQYSKLFIKLLDSKSGVLTQELGPTGIPSACLGPVLPGQSSQHATIQMWPQVCF